eukprot:COSAG01_NODE_18352_length_1082_cov_1.544252_1_plen_180_part_01
MQLQACAGVQRGSFLAGTLLAEHERKLGLLRVQLGAPAPARHKRHGRGRRPGVAKRRYAAAVAIQAAVRGWLAQRAAAALRVTRDAQPSYVDEFGFVQGGHAGAWADAYDAAACIVDARRAYATHRHWVDCGFETATSDVAAARAVAPQGQVVAVPHRRVPAVLPLYAGAGATVRAWCSG